MHLVDIVHPDVCLSEAQWNEVNNLKCLLCHPILFTKKLQAAHWMPGTLYKNHRKMLCKFTQTGSVVADAMRKCIET